MIYLEIHMDVCHPFLIYHLSTHDADTWAVIVIDDWRSPLADNVFCSCLILTDTRNTDRAREKTCRYPSKLFSWCSRTLNAWYHSLKSTISSSLDSTFTRSSRIHIIFCHFRSSRDPIRLFISRSHISSALRISSWTQSVSVFITWQTLRDGLSLYMSYLSLSLYRCRVTNMTLLKIRVREHTHISEVIFSTALKNEMVWNVSCVKLMIFVCWSCHISFLRVGNEERKKVEKKTKRIYKRKWFTNTWKMLYRPYGIYAMTESSLAKRVPDVFARRSEDTSSCHLKNSREVDWSSRVSHVNMIRWHTTLFFSTHILVHSSHTKTLIQTQYVIYDFISDLLRSHHIELQERTQ